MKIRDVREKAEGVLKHLRRTNDLNIRDAISVIEDMEELDEQEVIYSEQAPIAIAVFDYVIKNTESLAVDEIGVDLSYLLGAICKNGFVEWTKPDLPKLYDILREGFDINHPVWQHIAIFDEEKEEEVDA